jgi:hypothetical protein
MVRRRWTLATGGGLQYSQDHSKAHGHKGFCMPRLTDQEKADILRFVEADKPLPDKYRFLLFDDKREVELVWNGKTSEVCNVVLPFPGRARLPPSRRPPEKARLGRLR